MRKYDIITLILENVLIKFSAKKKRRDSATLVELITD